MSVVNKVKTLPKGVSFQEVYERGGKYYVVSTVGDVSKTLGASPGGAALGVFANMIGGYATSGEETAVFASDKDGNVTSWEDLVMVNGENSRARAMKIFEDPNWSPKQ